MTLNADDFGAAVGNEPFDQRARCEIGDRQWAVSLGRAAGGPQTRPPLGYRNYMPAVASSQRWSPCCLHEPTDIGMLPHGI